MALSAALHACFSPAADLDERLARRRNPDALLSGYRATCLKPAELRAIEGRYLAIAAALDPVGGAPRVLAVLFRLSIQQGGRRRFGMHGGLPAASLETVGALAGIGREAVQRGLKILEDYGLVAVYRRTHVDGRGQARQAAYGFRIVPQIGVLPELVPGALDVAPDRSPSKRRRYLSRVIAAYSARLPWSAALVLEAVFTLTDGGRRSARPTQEEIADLAGLSLSTTRRRLEDFQAIGLVETAACFRLGDNGAAWRARGWLRLCLPNPDELARLETLARADRQAGRARVRARGRQQAQQRQARRSRAIERETQRRRLVASVAIEVAHSPGSGTVLPLSPGQRAGAACARRSPQESMAGFLSRNPAAPRDGWRAAPLCSFTLGEGIADLKKEKGNEAINRPRLAWWPPDRPPDRGDGGQPNTQIDKSKGVLTGATGRRAHCDIAGKEGCEAEKRPVTEARQVAPGGRNYGTG